MTKERDFAKDKQNLGLLKKALGKNQPYTHVTLSGSSASASNGIIGITVPFESGINAVVAGAKFIDVLQGCSTFPSLKLTDANLIVKEGSFRALIPISAPELVTSDEEDVTAKNNNGSWSAQPDATTSKELLDALALVKHAVSKDASRGILCSVALIDGMICATDGHRITWKYLDKLGDLRGFRSTTFPDILINALSGVELIDTISCDDNSITIITGDNVSIKCARHAGKFPVILNVIPDIPVEHMFPVTNDMKLAVSKIKKHSDNGAVIFDGESIRDSQDQISVSGFSGLPKACLDVNYLSEVIANNDGVFMSIRGESDAVYLANSDTGTKHLIAQRRA